MKRTYVIVGAVGVVALVLLGILLMAGPGATSPNVPELISKDALSALPTKTNAAIDTSHLAKGVVPPTNKWFTGVALEETPQAVYPTPLSFLPTATSLQLGLPQVKATATDILGEAVNDLSVQVTGASGYKLTRYDQLSADLTYYAGTQPLGTVTITAGSPYVFFRAVQSVTLTASSSGQAAQQGNQVTWQTAASAVHMAGFSGARSAISGNQATVSLPQGSFVSMYELPAGSTDTLAGTAGNRITGTQVSYDKQGNAYRTNITYSTANGQPTVIATLPHQGHVTATPTALKYSSVYGMMSTIRSKTLSFTTPAVPVSDSLAVDKLTASQKSLLVSTLKQDAATVQFTANDTYFGGKQLYRAAQLMVLAHQLNQPDVAQSLQQQLLKQFGQWFSDDEQSPRYFYYDSTVHGIIGVQSSFGTDTYNDHHFHYGYFINAASLLAQYDPSFVQQYGDSVNLLVADIANYQQNTALPVRRNFDPYFGHSWASGTAPFADGNNQESSSEAINAWTGISLWAEQTHNDTLGTEAQWMLSNEIASSHTYWLAFDTNSFPYNQGFTHDVIGMNWGGKRDYATWFSAAPSAMLGIQLVPLNPTMANLAVGSSRIQQDAEEALPDGNYNVQFGDYILMYQALGGKSDTLTIAQTISDQNIDTANSRTYMYAWLMTHMQ